MSESQGITPPPQPDIDDWLLEHDNRVWDFEQADTSKTYKEREHSLKKIRKETAQTIFNKLASKAVRYLVEDETRYEVAVPISVIKAIMEINE